MFGNDVPVNGGGPVTNFDRERFDIGADRGLFVDAAVPARLLSRDLAGLEDAQLEHEADF